jgi:hypothetical protein
MASALLRDAIETLKSGDRDGARVMLEQVVREDPNSEMGWYYYAAVQDDPQIRRAYLERVLIINPNNAKAREILSKVDAPSSSAAIPDATTIGTDDSAAKSKGGTPIRPLTGADTPSAAESGGFALPVDIPGAPPRVSPNALVRDGIALFLRGVDVLNNGAATLFPNVSFFQPKPEVYDSEVAKATWWRFWFLVGFCAVAAALLGLFGGIIGTIFSIFGGFNFFRVFGVLVTFILTVPILMVGMFAATYASGWWAKEQKSAVPLVRHAYTAAVPFAPTLVINALLSLIPIVGGILGWLVQIFALYLMGFGFQGLHQFEDRNQRWITVAIYGVVYFVVVGILSIFLALFTAIGSIF